jgi:hypothetical protein
MAWERLMKCTPLPCYPGEHLPAISEPLQLFFAALALAVNKWWSRIIAMLISAYAIYDLGYSMLASCAFAHDEPVLSWSALLCWWQIVAFEAPRDLLNFSIALLVFSYAAFLLGRHSLFNPTSRTDERLS